MAQQVTVITRSPSVLKRQRQTITRTLHNRALKSTFRTAFKKILVSYRAGDLATYPVATAHKIIDKAKSKKLITFNAATRYKSRVAILANNKPAEAAK